MSIRARLIERGRAPSDDRSAGAAPRRLDGARPRETTDGSRPVRLGGPAAKAATSEPAPLARPAAPRASTAAFGTLALFLVVLYTRPQDLVPQLAVLRLAFVTGLAAAFFHATDALRRGEPIVRAGREVWLVAALLALGAASIPFALWPGGSFAVFTDQLVKVALAFVLVAHVVDTPARARVLVGVLVGAGVYLAAGALYLVATGEATRYGGRAEGIVGGMFRDPNDLALSLVVMMGLAGFEAIGSRSRTVRLLYVGALGVMLAGMLSTFSRGGLVALLAAAAVGLCRVARHGRGLALAGLVLLAGVAVAAAPSGYSERASSIVTGEDNGSIEARLTTLRHGVAILLEHPVVGVGLGNFRIAEGERHGFVGKWNEAHNAFIQIGAETGWAGLAVYVALALAAVANARAAARRSRDPRLVGTAHGLETALVGFLVGAMFLSQAYTWHFYILLGLAVALRRMADAEAAGDAPRPVPVERVPAAPARLSRWSPRPAGRAVPPGAAEARR
ncbi:MAG TPA: O-antigen ligase family protein [Thermodesulfobacteriota bacterium]